MKCFVFRQNKVKGLFQESRILTEKKKIKISSLNVKPMFPKGE